MEAPSPVYPGVSLGLRPPPRVVSSPLIRPVRLRGALAWTGQHQLPLANECASLSKGNNLARITHPTFEKATMPCQCDKLTQTDFKMAVAHIGTEQCRADIEVQVTCSIDAVSRGTERFVEDVSVQSAPSSTVYADAYTMPCVTDAATQVLKLVILSEMGSQTDSFTSSVGIQATDCSDSSEMGEQTNLVDLVVPSSFRLLAKLVHKLMTCSTMRPKTKNSMIKRIDSLCAEAERVNSSFQEILTCLELNEFNGLDECLRAAAETDQATGADEVYVSEEEDDASSTVPVSLSPTSSVNLQEVDRVFKIDPLLTSQVVMLLTQRCPALAANPVALQMAAYRELLYVHQLKAQAAVNSKVQPPPGLRPNGQLSCPPNESAQAEPTAYSAEVSKTASAVQVSEPQKQNHLLTGKNCVAGAECTQTPMGKSPVTNKEPNLSCPNQNVNPTSASPWGKPEPTSPLKAQQNQAASQCSGSNPTRTFENPASGECRQKKNVHLGSFKQPLSQCHSTTEADRDRLLVQYTAGSRTTSTKKKAASGGSTKK